MVQQKPRLCLSSYCNILSAPTQAFIAQRHLYEVSYCYLAMDMEGGVRGTYVVTNVK